jgi:hypothetical protein
MLRAVKVPVLFTTTFGASTGTRGISHGCHSDFQTGCVRELLRDAGVTVDCRSFAAMGHSMYTQDPQFFADESSSGPADLASLANLAT